MADIPCPLCNGPTEEHEAYRDRACPACGLAAPPDVLKRIRRMQMGWDNAVRGAGQYLVEGTRQMVRAEQAELRIRELTAQNVELKKDSDCWLGKLEAAERELAQLKQLADRVVTVADEATGPHHVQTADEALTCIERGWFKQRQRITEIEADVDHLKGAAETSYDRGKADARAVLADATRVWRMNCECACSACGILDDVLPDREGGRRG